MMLFEPGKLGRYKLNDKRAILKEFLGQKSHMLRLEILAHPGTIWTPTAISRTAFEPENHLFEPSLLFRAPC